MSEINPQTNESGPSAPPNGLTFWLTAGGHYRTRPVKVTRFTAKTVWVWLEGSKMERRELRHTQWSDYWPTKEEAEADIRKRAQDAIRHHEKRLAEAREGLAALPSNDQIQP